MGNVDFKWKTCQFSIINSICLRIAKQTAPSVTWIFWLKNRYFDFKTKILGFPNKQHLLSLGYFDFKTKILTYIGHFYIKSKICL